MANVNAITHKSDIQVGEGVYLERRDVKENFLEIQLRESYSRLPKFRSGLLGGQKVVEMSNAAEAQHQAMSDVQLLAAFNHYGKQMQRVGLTDQWVTRSFAAIREACRRTLQMRHHDVQLAGAWTLLQGRIAEMATGEGKTLVAALTASVGASTDAAVHVVTVNDYLSKRDAEENAPLFKFLGLTVGSIEQDMSAPDRQKQYACDITYTSNKELVFDYLKDQIAIGDLLSTHVNLRRIYGSGNQPTPLLRGLHMAIVDEADSVLIDEARTPLIISESLADEMGDALYQKALFYAKRLKVNEHYRVTPDRQIWLQPEGEHYLAHITQAEGGVWQSAIWRLELVQKALAALYSFHKDEHYIVAEDKIQIVDEFTGRVMPDRTWERGLHQMIEAKEGVEITGQRRTLAQMTYQRFFKRYLLLAGMTGTAQEVAPELKRVYDLDVLPIPTNKPGRRAYWTPRCWRTAEEKWLAIFKQATKVAGQGRAVLVGTRSVDASETLSKLFITRKVPHVVLNARQDANEAELIAQAGKPGQITIATNMAGRGTDIKLSTEVKKKGGLHVILTEIHESARIDRQLYGRSARQGDPGSVQALISLEDDAFKRYAPMMAQWISGLTKSGGQVDTTLLKSLVKLTQSTAEKKNRQIRLDAFKQDQKRREQMGFAGRKQ